MRVELNSWERLLAVMAGGQRRLMARKNDRGLPFGQQKDPWRGEIEGAAAEIAFAKAADAYWPGVVEDPFKLKGDVGGAQVKQTPYRGGRLLMHPDDPRHFHDDDAPYFLVIGSLPNPWIIKGWIYGVEGRVKKFWRTEINGIPLSPPCYAIPQSQLRDPQVGGDEDGLLVIPPRRK